MAWSDTSARDAALSVAATVSTHRLDAEAAARMVPEVREAMGGVGLFALAVPSAHGGREAPLVDLLGAVEVIAEADPSAAWHLCNTLAVPMAAAHLDEDVRRQVFAAELTRPFCVSNSPVGTARETESGFLLNGDWPFVTGVLEAEWVLLAAQVQRADGTPPGPTGAPTVGVLLVPTAAVEVRPTWSDAVAMKGTGSNAVSVRSLPVGSRFATSWWAPLTLDRPLYRISLPAMALIATGAVALGVGSACLRTTIETVGSRVSRADGIAYLDKPRVQDAIAESDAALRSLRAGYFAAMARLWSQAEGGPLTPRDEGPALSATFHAIDGARALVSSLYLAATPQVYAKAGVVERSLRDIFALSVGVEALRSFNSHTGRRLLQDG